MSLPADDELAACQDELYRAVDFETVLASFVEMVDEKDVDIGSKFSAYS